MSKPDLQKMLKNSLDSAPGKNVISRFDKAEEIMTVMPNGVLRPAVQPVATAPVVPLRLVPMADEGPTALEAGPSAETATPASTALRLPLALVHENPYNARQIYNPARIQELAANIAMHGQLVPAPVVPHPTLDGHYLLVDGHYRKLAIEAAGNAEIDCLVYPQVQDDFELYHLSFTINEQRSSQSALDNAIAWQHLLDKGVVKNGEALCQKFGFPPTLVSRTLSILKLPAAAIAKIKENPDKFKLKTTYELVLCGDTLSEEQLLALMDRICKEDLSSRKVEEIRVKLAGKTTRKPKESSCQYLRLHQGPARIGSLKAWDSGRIVLEVQVLDPKLKNALFEELKARFEVLEQEDANAQSEIEP